MARGMNVFFDLFRHRGSAPVARQRLQMLLGQERAARGGRLDLLAVLRDDILVTIARHIMVDDDHIHVTIDRDETMSRLEIEVEIRHQ
jgi:cell division topological specificity factor